MTEFPHNPSDVSAQMGPSLAQRLNDAGVIVGTHHISSTSTEAPDVELLRDPSASVESSTAAGISTAGDEWVDEPNPRDPFGAYQRVSLDRFGIENVEATRNPDISSAIATDAWNIVVSGSAGRAVWRERGLGDEWSGEWSDV